MRSSRLPYGLPSPVSSLVSLAVLLLVFGSVPSAVGAQTLTVRGFVTDAETGEALEDANVVLATLDGTLAGAGSSRDDGFYQIRDVDPGRYVFRVTFVGYEPVQDTLRLRASNDPFTRSVALAPSARQLDEVTVEAEGGASKVEAGKQQVRVADIDRIPTPSISGDVTSYLQSLPGVVSLGDRGGQLYVRGGTPSQNLVLMDGNLVYNPFHLIGFYSVFSENLVSNADFYAGGFGAEYTDRISSVLDVTMRPGNKKRFGATASASPFLTEVQLEGPITPNAFSFIASIRRSVIEETAPEYLSADVPLRFNDVYLKLHDVGENSQCALTALQTYDRGRIDPNGDATLKAENQALGGRCALVAPGSSQLIDITAGISRYENSIGSGTDPDREASIFRYHTKASATYPLSSVDVFYGAQIKANRYTYDVGEQFGVIDAAEDYTFTGSVFLGTDWQAREWIRVEPSVAVVWPTRFRASVEPRMRAKVTPPGWEGTELNAAAGYYKQTFEGVSDERDAGSVFTAWLPAPVEDKRSGSIHTLLGVQQTFDSGVSLSLEGYYRWLRDIPVARWSTLARFTTETTLADGFATGIDLRVEYSTPSLYGFLGYGFGIVEYESAQDDFGTWFGEGLQSYNPPHDQRHRLNGLVEWDFDLAKASVAWQFSTGLPFTQIIGFDSVIDQRDFRQNPEENYGVPRFVYDRPYDDRLPLYHRLDVTLERTFDWNPAALTLQLGAINVYDRSNVFYYDVFDLRRVDQLPVVPYLAVKMKI